MRGGLLLSEAPDFFDQVREALLGIGAIVSEAGDDVVLDGDSTSRALLYALEDDSWRSPEPVWPGEAPRPDVRRVAAVMVESRSEARVVELSRAVAASVDHPVWFLDAADVAWPAAVIDARRLRL